MAETLITNLQEYYKLVEQYKEILDKLLNFKFEFGPIASPEEPCLPQQDQGSV
jgi:hypothetical protein